MKQAKLGNPPRFILGIKAGAQDDESIDKKIGEKRGGGSRFEFILIVDHFITYGLPKNGGKKEPP
jgi:hypothetical protein